jgi:hypothetical protein
MVSGLYEGGHQGFKGSDFFGLKDTDQGSEGLNGLVADFRGAIGEEVSEGLGELRTLEVFFHLVFEVGGHNTETAFLENGVAVIQKRKNVVQEVAPRFIEVLKTATNFSNRVANLVTDIGLGLGLETVEKGVLENQEIVGRQVV